MPLGTLLQKVEALAQLGLFGNPCNNPLPVSFDMLNATVDKTETVAFPDDPPEGPDGIAGNDDDDPNAVGEAFEDETGERAPPENLAQAAAVTKWPAFIDRVLGDVQPLVRTAGITNVGGVDVLLQFLLFEPGTTFDTPLGAEETNADLGYPSVTLLQNIGDPEVEPAPGPITDFCSPLTSTVTTFATAEDGTVLARTPKEAGTYTFSLFARGQRDADGDGHENMLDPCPLDPDPDWDPRASTPVGPGDNDGDGLPSTCDPDDNNAVGDEDGDGYHNRQDNCAVIANGEEQKDAEAGNQTDSDFDGVGDACDPDPNDADAQGKAPEVLLTQDVEIGEDASPPTGGAEPAGTEGFNPEFKISLDTVAPDSPVQYVVDFGIPAGDVNFGPLIAFVPRGFQLSAAGIE